jgi:Transcriptional regulator, AbiEi antitoxin/Protein of unknown function (DUF559)
MTPDELSDSLHLSGIATWRDLLAAGMSRTQIATCVRKGALIRVTRGVYARPQITSQYIDRPGGDQLMRSKAALAVLGPGAVVSHESAAQLYNIDLLEVPGREVSLTCQPRRGWRGRPGVRLHATTLPPSHVSADLGFPITTPARTVIDLSRTLQFRAGLVAADSALHLRLATKAEMLAVIEALPRRPGISRARAVVSFADGRAESPLESLARAVFRNVGLPAPDLQVWVGGPRPVARVDFLWRKYRTVAEVDGAFKYDNPERAREQLHRDQLLRAEGYEVVHFSWHDINFTPNAVATQLREAFERGAAIAARRRAAG